MRSCLPAFAAACVLLLEPAARACLPPDGCFPDETTPRSDGAVMPVNAAVVRWHGGPNSTVDQIKLRDVQADLTLPIAFTQDGGLYDLRPAIPIEVGKTYRFEFPDNGCGEPFDHSFSTAAAAELATSELGTLVAEAPELVEVEVFDSVLCSVYVPAMRSRLELEVDPQLEPFAALLVYQTLVDGEPWGPSSSDVVSPNGDPWTGRHVDRLFATCPNGSSDGVSLGTHQVQMRATIPGFPDLVLESDVVEIVFECPPDEESGDGDEDDSSSESGSFVVPFDPGADDERGGCSCSTNGGPISTILGAPLLLLLATTSRRRSPR